MASLQSFLTSWFRAWQPCPPRVVSSTKYSVTLDWHQLSFAFLSQDLMYRLERKERLRGWVVQYCGSKTLKEIPDVGPCGPHRFRVRVILRTHAVCHLAHTALQHFGTERAVFEHFTHTDNDKKDDNINEKVNVQENVKVNLEVMENSSGDKTYKVAKENLKLKGKEYDKGDGDTEELNVEVDEEVVAKPEEGIKPWLESLWSEESWTYTESEGHTPASFCWAVRDGDTKQVQTMLEDRPALVEMINTTNGYTPLATAAIKGEVNIVKLLLSSGADVDGLSANNRTALHVALLAGHADVAAALMDQGALIQRRDVLGLRAEHCAVDGGSVAAVRGVLGRGGDLTVRDHNGWTPLFRAVVGEAATPMIVELIRAGSDVDVTDVAGLTLRAAANVGRINELPTPGGDWGYAGFYNTSIFMG